ncbi:Ger(x)C family spore germination protein [Cytobacillus sp.]|uniref:Ger(x)C family spore germination protein n=1 Tax=Cytobacillus sp. TaxID=2675269 RepID=UPI0028BDAE94|nr:Ger(x)C family spore germination protein [Cytobacillus sp.]
MKRVLNIVVLSIIMSMFLSGCMNIKERILDDIQLATAAAYEYIDEDKIEVTAVFPNFQPDKSVKNETLVASSILSKEIRDKHSLQSEKPLVSGKLEVTLYEKKTAERGIKDLLDTLQRDPSVGSNVYLAVIDGSPRELLSKQYGNMDNGIFLSNLIEQNIESGLIHKTNLHQFLYKYYAEGIDPMLPIIGRKDGKINLKAIGLFDNDKMVDHIEEKEYFYLKILLNRKGENDTHAIQLDGNTKVSIFNIRSKRKYQIPKPMTNNEIIIQVKIKSMIREYNDGILTKQKLKELEQAMEEDIKKNSEEMIKKFQEKKIDPLGVGEEVRTRTRKWNKEKWEEIYPDIKISVQVTMDIIESGIIE